MDFALQAIQLEPKYFDLNTVDVKILLKSSG